MNHYGRSAVAANVVIGICAVVAVILRVLARRQQKHPLRSDDYTILVALLITVGLCCEGIYTGATNLIHTASESTTLADLSRSQKIIWVDVLLTNMLYGIIKISVLLFYRRIFTTKSFRMVSNVFLVVVSTWMVSMFLCQFFISTPLSNFWTHPTMLWNFDFMLWIFSNCCLDIFFDVSILCLPLPSIYILRMSWKSKLQVMSVFALGFFCVAASIVKAWYAWQLHLLLTDRLPPSSQPSIEFWDDLWSHIEGGASVVAACLPTLAPLFIRKGAQEPFSSLRRRVENRYSSFSSTAHSDRASSHRNPITEKTGAQEGEIRTINSSDVTVSGKEEDDIEACH